MKSHGVNRFSMWKAAIAAVVLVGSAACHSGGLNTPSVHPRPAGEAPSDALVAKFGGRAPRPCPAITSRPSDAEAAVLVQCTMEGPFGNMETLLTNVQVHVTGARNLRGNDSVGDPDTDPSGTMYDITGNELEYICGDQSFPGPGKNCLTQHVANAQGTCWKTKYGEYRCSLISGSAPGEFNVAPPTAY